MKNTTESDIDIRGRTILASGQRDFTAFEVRLLDDDETNISTLIDAGDIVINNGTIDLNVDQAKRYLFGRSANVLEFEYVEDNAASTTNTTTPQQKLRLSLTNVEAGDYLVEWGAEIRVSNTGRRIGVRLQLDDTMNVNDTWTNPSINTNDWGPIGGFCKLPLTAGNHTFDLDFASSNAGRTVGIRQARIKVTKAI